MLAGEDEREKKVMSVLGRLAIWARLVKLSHTIFALPFALVMVVVVARHQHVSPQTLLLLVVALAAARTAAMAFNRWRDASIDASNPRTSNREIPAGLVSRNEALILTLSSCLAFVGCAALLGPHCVPLAFPVLFVLLGYSYVKTFSALCHAVLGLALALAPGGVWFALTAQWSWRPVPLMATVLVWVAGFDILYSCQDLDYDRQAGLFSVPARVGLKASLWVARILHATVPVLLVVFGREFDLGLIYYAGVGIFALLLVNQHVAVAKRGVSCLDQVFFTRNGAASVVLLLTVVLDSWFGH